MTAPLPSETAIEDAARIADLTKHRFRKVATRESDWTILYQDPNDGRYWELTYPQSELHGGGPPLLSLLKADKAMQLYAIADQNTYYPLTDEEQKRKNLGGMSVNERLVETKQMDAFERAEKHKDKEQMRKILASIYVDEPSIQKILNRRNSLWRIVCSLFCQRR